MARYDDTQRVIRTGQKYTMLDYVKIPFKAAPLASSIKALYRILNSFIPTIKVFITAAFVNDAIRVVRGEGSYVILLPAVCGFVLMTMFSRVSATIINDFVNIRYDMKIYSKVQAEVIDIRSEMTYENVEDPATYNLIERVGKNVLGYMTRGSNNVFDIFETYIHIYALTAIIIWNQAWWAGLVIVLISFILSHISIKSGKRVYDAYASVAEKERLARYYDKVLTDRDHVNERKIFAIADHINSRWRRACRDEVHVRVKARADSVMEIEGVGIVLAVTASLVTAMMVPGVVSGRMTAGMFVAVATAIYELSSELGWRFVNVSRTYSECKEYLKDLTLFCSLKLDDQDEGEEMSEEFASVEFVDVSFKYADSDEYILKDLSVRFDKNEHYAIVGANGAGKSTMIKLMLGLYKDYEGKILLNGKDIRRLSSRCIRRIFSATFQDFAKYQLDIRDNCTLGDEKIMDDDIRDVISRLGCGDLIQGMPDGLDTLIGKIYDDSRDLSGGEWQKVALIRNFVRDSSVKILDEPTAALDPILESELYTAFAGLCLDHTTILITHRLAAVRSANKVIVLDGGNVKECGSHDELMERDGIYAQMYKNQMRWYRKESGKNG